jgi:hypothetical protein
MKRINIKRWLRWRLWDLEDFIADRLIDWQPHREPTVKPLPPGPPQEPQHHGSCLCTSVSFDRLSNEQAHSKMWNAVFKALGRGQFFEMRH